MRFRDFLRRRKSPLPAAPGGAVTVEQPESDGASSDKKPAKTDGENKDAGSSLVRSDVQHQQPSQVSDASGKLYSWDSLWAEAYETVKEDAESSELLREFEKKLIEDGGLTPRDASAGSEGAERLQLIQRHAVRKLERLPETQLAFSFYEKRIVVRKLVLKAIQVISTFKPIITAAVSAEPHAALAWAGIMTILPMLETAFQQDEDAANGLNSIVFLLVQYQDIQETSLVAEFKEPSRSDATQQLLLAMRTKLVSIYAQIYVYQIRFVLQFARGAVHQTMRNLTSADSWKQMWEDIKAASDLVKEGIQSRVGARTFETWKAVNDAMKRMDGIEALQQATLTAVQDGNETNLLLSLPSAENALFDSAEIVRAEASCMEGTQRRILNDIQDWAESPSGEVVFWLHGMAGTGKTSVALTVANALCGRKPFTVGGKPPSIAVLGASFFFKQSDATRNSTRNFFPTLARCLAKVFPDLKSLIVGAITQDLEIGTKAPRQQLNDLIVRPLIRLDEQICLPIRLIVVVDALDECVERTEAKELIEMLAVLEARLHQVQLRFLITSRREELIVRGFSKLPNSLYRSLLLGKIQPARDGDINRDDIALYLSYTLAEIASRNDVSQQWIGEAGIKQLCEKADGLFIYAATACRFLDAPDFTDEDARRERLDLIVHDEEDADAPQQKVDEIYLKVLSFPHLTKSLKKTKARHLAQISKILGFIAILLEPVSALSLGHLVSIPRATLDDWLTRLHSIVSVPQDEMSPLGLVHLSFRDFILSEERSRLLEFRVEESTMHEQIFQRCLDLMSDMLCQDICGLVLTGTLASEVPQSQIKQSIPQHLQYACRYWVDHLAKLDDETRMREGLMDQGKVHTFLQKSFLYWLEAMSLIRETPTTILMINRLQTLMNPSEHGNLCSLVYDAKRFILSNRWIISHAPLQIYASALIFAPEKSLIRAQFKHMMPPWIIKRPAVEQYWTAELNTLEGHTDFITSIAFSPSDDLVATGSLDGTTRLWDYVTGTERLKFDDKKKINCVAFSRDGKSVASALPREVMRVRKFAKGSMIELKPQGGRMGRITQVAFSGQDDNTLASITADRKLRVWNVDQRREIHICEILEDNPFAVPTRAAFSPDGKFVVVGPNLGRPILWSVETGKFVKTLELYEGGTDGIAIYRQRF